MRQIQRVKSIFLSSTAKFKSLFALIIDFDEHITLKLFKCTRRKTKSETLEKCEGNTSQTSQSRLSCKVITFGHM